MARPDLPINLSTGCGGVQLPRRLDLQSLIRIAVVEKERAPAFSQRVWLHDLEVALALAGRLQSVVIRN